MTTIPIYYEWRETEQAMYALPRFRERCAMQFRDREIYRLDIAEDPSDASRGHYFAVLKEAWKSLPEAIAPRYPSVDRLRKKALIRTGFADERTFVFDTPADAVKLSGIVQTYDEDAVVLVKGNVVHVFTAQSQSARVMKKERFQASKVAVLDEVSKLIGTDVTTLQAQVPGPREYMPEDQ